MNTDTVDNQDKQDSPFVLPNEISKLLSNAGVIDTVSWLQGLPEEAYSSPDLSVQRKHVNRHLRHLFADLPNELIPKTTTARGCLMEDNVCDIADYMRLMRTRVIPCAIEVGVFKTQ